MKKRNFKPIHAMLPALLLCSPAVASSARTVSRHLQKGYAVKSESYSTEQMCSNENVSGVHDPFAIFTDKSNDNLSVQGRNDSEVIEFLYKNDLLTPKEERPSVLSGDLHTASLGRKEFAHASPYSHCHTSFGTYNTNSYTSTNRAQCEDSWSGEWHPADSSPFFENTNVSNKTATSFDVNIDVNQASTVYAVLVSGSATAPSSAQVKAGLDGSGASALQHKTPVVNASPYTDTLSFTGLSAGASYLVYLVAENSSNEITPAPVVVNPAFEFGEISATGTWKFPKVRTDSSGDFYTMHKNPTTNGIQFIKWNDATSSWDNYATIEASDITGRAYISYGNEYGASFDFDSNDNLHVVFRASATNMANTSDPFHGEYNGTDWTFKQVCNDTNYAQDIRVFVDDNDNVHMAYHVGYNLRYATNASGDWPGSSGTSRDLVTAGQVIAPGTSSGTDEIHDAHVIADTSGASDVVTIYYRREYGQNNGQDNYFKIVSTNYFATAGTNTLELNGKGEAVQYRMGNVFLDADDKTHYIYSRNATGYYRTNASGSWTAAEQITSGTNTVNSGLDVVKEGTATYILTNTNNGYLFFAKEDGESWVEGTPFDLDGWFSDKVGIDTVNSNIMIVSENSSDWTINYHTGPISGYLPGMSSGADSDGSLIASATVTEPVGLETTIDTTGEAVDVFDFTLSDGGGGDGLSMDVSQIVLNVSGTTSDSVRANITWRLNGNDASNVVGTYNSGSDTISFSGLNISVADGASETYTINAYYNDNTGLTEDQTVILSVDGDTDLTVSDTGTLMGATSVVNSGSGTTVDITATSLAFTTQPATSISGSALGTQPVVTARDAFSNTDVDFSETITLTESGPGSLSGDVDIAAVNGVAVFTDVTYSATADQQSFTLSANDEDGTGTDLSSIDANAVTSDVVATNLVFTTQPAGSVSGSNLITQPVVIARDANGVTDTGFTETITLTEASAGTLTGGAVAAVAGVATFNGVNYSATADQESFTITANDQDGVGSNLATVNANLLSSDVVATQLHFSTQPSPTSIISGQETAFTTVPVISTVDGNSVVDTGYNAADIVMSLTDPIDGTLDGSVISLTGTGDLDADGTTVTLRPSLGVATYTGLRLSYSGGGLVDDIALRAASGSLTNATSNSMTAKTPPTVTDGNISISGASGTGGSYVIGDTVTVTWDNTGSGDNNSGISSVTVDFSAFGGSSSVSASNSAGTWTATYNIVAGTVDSTSLNVSVTAMSIGGTSTTADTSNASVDNQSPVITDASVSLSGASGTGGAFKVGDTVTASWDNTAGGDNNTDISSVTFDFSQFGGGAAISANNSAGTWTASYTVTEDGGGSIDATSRNVSVTATDDSGNTSTTADATNATVDNDSPVVTDGNISLSGASGTAGAFKVGDTVTATWNNTAGGDNNSDTIGSVFVNFSQFGGGSAVSASNSGDTWAATYTITEKGGGAIDATNRNVSVTVADNAGNTSTAADTTNATVDNDSPVVTDNNISLSGATGTGGTFMAGDRVFAAWDNGTNGDNNADTISEVNIDFSAFGGGTAVGATATPGPSGNVWVATYTLVSGSANGTNLNVSVTATDNAGNITATAGTANATADTTAPVANFGSATDDVGSVTGPLSSGDTTDDTALLLAGSNESGSSVNVYNGTALLGAAIVSGTNWSYTATVADGITYQFNVTETDNVGNTSSPTSYFTVIGDTAAPVANFSSVTDDVGSITGVLSSGDITDDTALELAGTNESGSTVNVYNGATLLGSAAISGTNWSYTAAVADGTTYQFNVKEIDGAGNSSSATSNFTVTGDTTPPAEPSVPDMTALTDNGVSTTDNKTSDTSPTFLGTAETGATVTLTSSINGLLGSDTADGSGNWAITPSTLNYGVHTITALAKDAAGNVSPSSGGLSVVINHDPTFTGIPTITGTLGVHETLGLTYTDTADLDAGDSVTLSYQWLRDGIDITGETSDTYVLQAKDRISNISCRLSARDLNGGETIFTTGGVRVKGSFPWSILIPAL